MRGVDIDSWISASDAARRARVSRPRIHQLVRQGALEGRHLAGRLLVHEPSLQAWAEKRGRFLVPQVMTMEFLRQHRERLKEVAAHRGARSLAVFGSVARGEAQADSDVDFLIELEKGRNVLDLAALIVDLEEELGRSVDVVEIRVQSPATERVRREAIPL
jgi:predicted nucleotidyltransferase